MPTVESQKLRDLITAAPAFCKPEHNYFHAMTCPACQSSLHRQAVQQGDAVPMIYALERKKGET